MKYEDICIDNNINKRKASEYKFIQFKKTNKTKNIQYVKPETNGAGFKNAENIYILSCW